MKNILRFLNYTQSRFRLFWFWIRGYQTLVPAVEWQNRRIICDRCYFLDRVKDECSLCGCPKDAKTALASESCPLHKWVAVRVRK